MNTNIETNWVASRSGLVAPTFAGAPAGVCPQTAFRRVDGLHQVTSLTVAGAAMRVGHRSWSPLIT